MSNRGFTLMELAVSLCVIALVLGSIIVPLQTQIETRKVDETRRLLDLAHEMLLGYAAANGYFPCPADEASQGQEAAGSDHTTGVCASYHGYFPAALLGFRPTDAQGYGVDAWGTNMNRLRYAVANHTVSGIVNPITRINGMRSVAMGSLAVTPLFHICQSGDGVSANDCGTAVTLANNAAVVVWSVGPNAASGGLSVHEAQNPNPNGGSVDRVFVNRGVSAVAGHEFDDLVTWIPVTVLLSRLVATGQFTPAAQGVSSPPVTPP
ncbi:MAG TPA: prepilin-type N-terminal cleavage/methylation domain-containing protein [Burkholderiales bacterium]|nr:prepilin-type N-terminal cleavage/methylation domain-containing protein [Burkholderiales bacterium]